MSGRSLTALAIGVSVLLVGCAPDPTGAADDLHAALAELPEPDRFTVTYEAHGTQVLDCFARHRRFVLEIDRPSQTVSAHSANGTPLAQRDDDMVWLHRSLFAPSSLTASWIQADLRMLDAGHEAALRRALGGDLAGYLLAPDLPSSGEAIAAAVAEIADGVELLSETANGVTYRITLDTERFAADSTGPGAVAPSGSASLPPTLDVTIGEGRVSQVTVRPPHQQDGAAAGWSVEFGPLEQAAAPTLSGPVLAIGRADPAQLTAATSEPCELGGGT